MTKVILSGCSGKMGHAIVKAIDERNDCEIACGVDTYIYFSIKIILVQENFKLLIFL